MAIFCDHLGVDQGTVQHLRQLSDHFLVARGQLVIVLLATANVAVRGYHHVAVGYTGCRVTIEMGVAWVVDVPIKEGWVWRRGRNIRGFTVCGASTARVVYITLPLLVCVQREMNLLLLSSLR